MKITGIVAEAPIIQKMADRDKWAYAADWSCDVVLGGEGAIRVKIRSGYWTDLASVPRGLRGAFDNGSGELGVLIASQVHDMFYSTHFLSKDFADELFYLMLRRYGMGWAKAKAYYLAVHWFGDSAWETLSDEEMARDRRLCSLEWLDKP